MTLEAQVNVKEMLAVLSGQSLTTTHTHVLLACIPKSGSTYLTKLIAALPGMHEAQLVTGQDRREQELSVEQLLMYHANHYVSQNHVRYSTVTAHLIRAFGLTPLVLVRNIFDAVVSFHDHHRDQSTVHPMAAVPPDIASWPTERAYTFIVDMMIPWFFNFYVTWQAAPNVLLLRYEELIVSPEATLRRVVDFAQMRVTPETLAAAVAEANAGWTRKNVGITGRGASLPEDLKQRIVHMSRYYPNIDFSPIGIS